MKTTSPKTRRPFAPAVFLKNNFNHDIWLYGGVEAAFWAAFAALAFTSAYLAQEGFKSSTVGVIMAVISVLGIVFSTIIGNITDKIGSPRKVLIFCAVVSSVFYAFVPMLLGVKFAGISLGVVFIFLWAAFSRPMQGLCEGWVVSAADKRRTFVFGAVRYFGSISYALVCIIFGAIVKRVGTQSFTFWSYGILCLPLIALALSLRGDDKPKEAGAKKEKKKGASYGVGAAMKNYYFVMFLICHCFICLPMNCSTTFVPYKLAEIGASDALGNVTAIRALMEVPMLLGGSWIVRKFGIKKLFIFDMILFLASQLVFLFAKSAAAITLAMMLMGTAYGAHLLGQVNYVYRITPHEAVASAQSLSVSFSLVASVAASLVGGVIIEAFGTSGMYIVLFCLEAFALLLFLVTYPLGRLLKKPEPDLSHIV